MSAPTTATKTDQVSIDLDGLYPAEVIAPWMGISKRGLLELARRKKVPVMRLNERVLRFHPRTILEAVK